MLVTSLFGQPVPTGDTGIGAQAKSESCGRCFQLRRLLVPLMPALDGLQATCHIVLMNRDQVINTLRNHEAELKAAGVIHLALFGSTARGESRPDSDIDLLASFDEDRDLSLLDLAGIEVHLSELLGAPVDLIEEGTLKLRIDKNVAAEAVRAF